MPLDPQTYILTALEIHERATSPEHRQAAMAHLNAQLEGETGGEEEGESEEEEDEIQEAAPGPPPRPGLEWDDTSHRWVSPEEAQAGKEPAASAPAPSSPAASQAGKPDAPAVSARIAPPAAEAPKAAEKPQGGTPPDELPPPPPGAPYPDARYPLSGKQAYINYHLPDEARPDLSKAEASAIGSYTGESFEEVNAPLHRGEEPDSPRYAFVHKNLKTAFAKAKKFPKPVTVHRGLKLSGSVLDNYVGKIAEAGKSGAIIELPGYQSTSTLQDEGFGGNIELEIEADHGIDVSTNSQNPHEMELLLNHNSKYEVASHSQEGGKHKIKLRQVTP